MIPKYVYVGMGIAVSLAAIIFIVNSGSKPVINIEVIHGETPTASGGIKWTRLKITNNAGMSLTDVVIDMGSGDIQQINKIAAGETIFLSPKSDVTNVAINTNEGISVKKMFEPHPGFSTQSNSLGIK